MLLGHLRQRETDRFRRGLSHSQRAITAKMPKKIPSRTIGSRVMSCWVIAKIAVIVVIVCATVAAIQTEQHEKPNQDPTICLAAGAMSRLGAGAVGLPQHG